MTGASGYLAESGPRGTLRFFLGRPDPALAYGMVPAVLAGRVALAKAARVGETFGVKVAPILGAGALPFRGTSPWPTWTVSSKPSRASGR